MADPWTDSEKNARRDVHQAIQASNDANPEIEEAVLVNWALVAEWSDPEGQRWISRLSGNDGGEDSPPRWTVEGLLHYALYSFDQEK